MAYSLDPMAEGDWSAVKAIYREGLATGLAAFMTDPPGWRAWNKGHLAVGRIVARHSDGRILGWAALAPVPDT